MTLTVLGVVAWRLSEVQTAPAPERFVELESVAGGCLFPSTQVAVYDGAGAVLDVVAPVTATTCFDPGTFLVVPAPPDFAAGARQVCLRSSGTIYDCVRWQGITVAVHDLFGPDDDSVAATPAAGYALARIAESHVVADDWIVAEPTPGAVNDGTPYDPPDAGPTPDAGPPPDAAIVPDAGPVIDARPEPDAGLAPDARSGAFLDLDAQGGACGCQAPADPGGGLLLLLTACRIASGRRRSRRRAPPAGPTSTPAPSGRRSAAR